MTRTRDKPVPITETFSALDGLVKKTLQPLPQAIHHFTQADQVDQLVGASEADADMGFMARLLTLCSMPRTNSRHQDSICPTERPLHHGDDGGRTLPSSPSAICRAFCWPGSVPKR